MSRYQYRFEGQDRGLRRTIEVDDSDVSVGSVVELEFRGIRASYEIVGIESTPPIRSQQLNPRRRSVKPSPPLLVLRKVELGTLEPEPTGSEQ